MEYYYRIQFLRQEFKRHKLTREYAVASITLKAKSDSEAFREAEFLLSVNNPEITYDCMTAKIEFHADQFKYEIF